MTTDPTPVPDAAVSELIDALRVFPGGTNLEMCRHLADALSRHYELCPPGTTAEVAALRAAGRAFVDAYGSRETRDAALYQAMTQTRAALDALPARDAAPAGAEDDDYPSDYDPAHADALRHSHDPIR